MAFVPIEDAFVGVARKMMLAFAFRNPHPGRSEIAHIGIFSIVTPNEPESPCNRRCTLDPDADICLGCYRTLEKITGWLSYSAKQKLAVLGKLPARKRDYRLKRSPLRSRRTNLE